MNKLLKTYTMRFCIILHELKYEYHSIFEKYILNLKYI